LYSETEQQSTEFDAGGEFLISQRSPPQYTRTRFHFKLSECEITAADEMRSNIVIFKRLADEVYSYPEMTGRV
jgi:hypothetical protein